MGVSSHSKCKFLFALCMAASGNSGEGMREAGELILWVWGLGTDLAQCLPLWDNPHLGIIFVRTPISEHLHGGEILETATFFSFSLLSAIVLAF